MTVRGNGGSRKGGRKLVSAVVSVTSLVALLGAARRSQSTRRGDARSRSRPVVSLRCAAKQALALQAFVDLLPKLGQA